MKLNIGAYRIESDNVCFILSKVGKIEKSEKPENIGKEKLTTIGYYSSLNQLISGLANHTVLTTDSLDEIMDKLDELQKSIDRVADKLTLRLPKEGK